MSEQVKDWFYMKTNTGDVCDPTAENANCDKNRTAVQNLRDNTDSMGAAMMQYEDAKTLYNRELLFMVNILAGLVLICYYIYRNQSAIPSPSDALKNMGTVSSFTSRLSMSPTAVLPKTK